MTGPVTPRDADTTASVTDHDRVDPLVAAAAVVVALSLVVPAIWALASPGTFADAVGFGRAGDHLLHDAAAFQLGLGVALLLAPIWRDPLTVCLAGSVVACAVHAVGHIAEASVAGWLLAALAVVAGAATLRQVRRGGWVVGRVGPATVAALVGLRTRKTVVLTTYRCSGAAVPTPVSIAVDGDRAVFRSFAAAGKTARLRRDQRVAVAASTARGRVVGAAVAGHARQLDGPEADRAATLLRRKYPLLHGVLVPLMHRLLRSRFGATVHFEFTPDPGGGRRDDR